MNGYIAQRRNRFYVVIYEGRDPVTGKEQRRWHPAGTDRAEAEGLMTKLAAEETRRVESVRSLTLGAYLTSQRSEEHTSELQSLMRISYAVFCLKKKNITTKHSNSHKKA